MHVIGLNVLFSAFIRQQDKRQCLRLVLLRPQLEPAIRNDKLGCDIDLVHAKQPSHWLNLLGLFCLVLAYDILMTSKHLVNSAVDITSKHAALKMQVCSPFRGAYSHGRKS